MVERHIKDQKKNDDDNLNYNEQEDAKREVNEDNFEEEGVMVSAEGIGELPEPSSLSEAGVELKYTRAALKNFKKEFDELNEKYLKSLAESDNFRKRISKEKEESLKYSNESLIKDLLPILDYLDLAICHSVSYVEQDTSGNLKSFIDGMKMAYGEFIKILEKYGLKVIETEDKIFDANLHEVVEIFEDSNQPAGKILEEKRKGYMFKDRLIRPSLICVSKPK
jgi:molecular chaperone GrpE